MYDKVLVPLDGSPSGWVALTHAIRLSPGEIVLVAVVEPTAHELARQVGIAADIPNDIARDVEQSALAEREGHLEHAEDELRKMDYPGPIRRVIRHGKPGPEIVRTVAELKCEAVVMTTHGRTGLRRVLLGSVADYVLSHLAGPALVLVRPTDTASRP